MKLSVAMAVYNGEKYIAEQINSILCQIDDKDELVISYNYSTDKTWEIIMDYAKSDNRVLVFQCEEKGVIPNFEYAISKCTGDVICLSDQDDIWVNNKAKRIKELIRGRKKTLLMHNCDYIDKNGKELQGNLFEYRNAHKGFLKNLVRNSYQGCCIAFTADLCEIFLSIPRSVPMHDQWFGLVTERIGNVIFIDEKLIHYRRRDDNTSRKRVGYIKKVDGMSNIIKEISNKHLL